MSKTKKVILCALYIIVLCSVCLWSYFNQYHINNNNISIETNLKEWLNRGTEEEMNPRVIDVMRLDHSNSYIALFQLANNNFGYAHLIEGLNGKLKFEQTGYGTNEVSFTRIETKEGLYGIVVGYNPDYKIDHLLVKFSEEELRFALDVSKDEKFLKYEKLPNDLKEYYPKEINFFDKNNKIIH